VNWSRFERCAAGEGSALNQAAALSSFNNMYGQAHQGQHVMMNGGQAHQRSEVVGGLCVVGMMMRLLCVMRVVGLRLELRDRHAPDTPSPSRSPALNQAAALSSFNNMYGQAHQGQHVMMVCGGHDDAAAVCDESGGFATGTSGSACQTAGGLDPLATTTTSHFNSTHLQNGVPTAEDDIDESMNEHWVLLDMSWIPFVCCAMTRAW
jgi:hypothetical protein